MSSEGNELATACRSAASAIREFAAAVAEIPHGGATIRRATWPESKVLRVTDVDMVGVQGQLMVDGRPVGPDDAFYAHTPLGVDVAWVMVSPSPEVASR